MTVPNVKIVADSYSPTGQRLTTMQVMMPRIVLAEFNTHRLFSRNSASSRAIPVEKQLRRVNEDPFIPFYWGKNQKGMQADEELTEAEQKLALDVWLGARDQIALAAETLREIGVHKQITNRLLEPFMWHTVIVTSTDYENFFTLRCSPLAMPEIRATAECMRLAYDHSEPVNAYWEGWHLPYINDDDIDWADDREHFTVVPYGVEALKQVSVARCARVSYLTQEGVRDPKEDLAMYERLVTAKPMHASPLEHVATPCQSYRHKTMPHLGNLEGWDQLRHMVEGRIRSD